MSQNDAPVRGFPLWWRLGLTTSVLVTLVLGTLTSLVQTDEIAVSYTHLTLPTNREV